MRTFGYKLWMYSMSEKMKVFSGSNPKAMMSLMLDLPISIVWSSFNSYLYRYFSSSVI